MARGTSRPDREPVFASLRELRIRVLGEFSVEGFAAGGLGSRKARLLLAALAMARGRPVSRDALVDILWADAPPRQPDDQLAVLVSRLRAVVGSDRLVRTASGYRLSFDWLDLEGLEALTDEARERLRAGSLVAARTAVAAALTLCRGPLLAGELDAGWLTPERERVDRLVLGTRRLGAEAAAQAADHGAAVTMAEDVLDHDPYDEVALRVAMWALAASGRRPSALDLYERFRARLDDDLGVSPSADVSALQVRLLKDQALQSAPESADRARPSDVAPAHLPGRDAALAELDGALERAGAGRGGVVAVIGEQGMGKTRLLRVWTDSLRPSTGVALSGRCEPATRALPLQAVLDAIGDHLTGVGRDRAEAILGEDRPLLGALLASPLAGGVESSALALADPAYGQTMLFNALLRVMARIDEGRPVALLIDDVHFASAATLDWLHFAATRLPATRLLVVISHWPELRLTLPGSRTVTLEPLDLTATTEIVGADRAAGLHRRSRGNPLFLTELAASDEDADLPASIREAVDLRIDLAGAAADSLRAAAVIGASVDLDLLSGVLRRPPIRLLDDLETGHRLLFLEERDGGFSFRHQLVREALVEGTTMARQALLHREAGRILASRPAADPLEVADHSRRGGDTQAAAAALLRAAAAAMERHAYADAAEHASQAALLHPSEAADLEHCRALLLGGRFGEAAAAAEQALSRNPSAAMYELAGAAAYYLRRLRLSTELAERGIRLGGDPRYRLGCMVVSGRANHGLGDTRTANHRLEAAMSLAGELNVTPPSAALAFLRVHQGRAAEAVELLDGTLSGARLHRFAALTPLHGRFIAGYALATAGRAGEALQALEEAETEAQLHNIERYLGLADNFRGWVLRQLGVVDEADGCNRRAREWAHRVGYQEAEVYAILDLADGRLQTANLVAAATLLDEAAPLLVREYSYAWRNRMRANLLLARLAISRGDADAALAHTARVLDDATHFGSPRYVVLATLTRATAAAMTGRPIGEAAVEVALASVEVVAGLEAWWVTEELAAAVDSVRWRARAREMAERLGRHAGPHAPAFATYVQARFDRYR